MMRFEASSQATKCFATAQENGAFKQYEPSRAVESMSKNRDELCRVKGSDDTLSERQL
jgi:hypothetical protein